MQEGIATTALRSKTPFAALAQVGTRDAQIPALLQSRSTAFNSWQLFARAERSLLCCTMERTALSCAKTRIPNTVTLLHPAQLRGADLTLLGVGNVGFGAEKERSPKPNPTLPMRRSTLSSHPKSIGAVFFRKVLQQLLWSGRCVVFKMRTGCLQVLLLGLGKLQQRAALGVDTPVR